MELLRQVQSDRVTALVRMGAVWFAVRWRDGRQEWRVLRRLGVR
ncbi:hypothetical protein ABE488_00835 [Luteimonas sp. TWI662]